MTYFVDRLPKDVAVSLSGGVAGALTGGLVTCLEATREFTKQYPHDGQNGLGGLYFGALSMPFFGLLSAIAIFLVRYRGYRKLIRLEADRAFDEELLAARASK